MLKTIVVFFESPTREHYLLDISRHVGLAHTSIKQNLSALVKLKMVIERREKKGHRIFPLYLGNKDYKEFKRNKLVYNLSALFASGLIDFIEEKLMPKTIVLFGSYSRGEDIETSDIDLFVECKEEGLNLKHFEKKLKRKIELHFKENFTTYPSELKNNIINGIVLYGFLEGYHDNKR